MQCWVFKLQTRRYKMNDEWVNIQLKKRYKFSGRKILILKTKIIMFKKEIWNILWTKILNIYPKNNKYLIDEI